MNVAIGIGVALAAAAGLGVGGYEVWKHHHMKQLATGKAVIPAGSSLDTGMDTYTANVVSAALTKETDTGILDTLAANLKAAGFTNSAQAVATRSSVLKAAITSTTKATTAVKGIITGFLPAFAQEQLTGCGGPGACECEECSPGQTAYEAQHMQMYGSTW